MINATHELSLTRHWCRRASSVGRKHVATLMRKMGLEAIYRRANTSRRHPRHPVFPYLLRGLAIDRPNQVWAADVTYIPMARGFVYLVAVIDWFSRRILSWRLSNSLTADFCVEALEEAIARYAGKGSFSPGVPAPACTQ
jgi:putative transposase